MTNEKFTPGPWKVIKLNTRRVIRGANDELVGVIESGMTEDNAKHLSDMLASHQSPTGYALAQAVVEWENIRRIEYDRLRTDPNYPNNLDDLAQKMGPIRDNIVTLARQFLTAVDGKEE